VNPASRYRIFAARGVTSCAGRKQVLRCYTHQLLTLGHRLFLAALPAMSSLSAISLSGLNAAQSSLDVSAHNIANLATDGFHRQQAIQSSTPAGGVTTSVVRGSEPGSALETDMVDMLQAKGSFLANLAVFRTSDRMMGSLLDVVS
jgi:flagellar hook-associated protein FlgK